jgi:hypothetical protein
VVPSRDFPRCPKVSIPFVAARLRYPSFAFSRRRRLPPLPPATKPQADLHEKITDLRDQFDDLMQEEATKATPTKNFQRIAELESQLQCEMDNFCLIDQVLAKQHLANESKLS